MGATQRFQPYVEDWSTGQQEIDEYDLESVSTIPVSIVVASADVSCSAEQAKDLSTKLKTLHNYVTIEGANHSYFYKNNSEGLLEYLTDELELPV